MMVDVIPRPTSKRPPAVAGSFIGTFETCRMTLRMSANRARPEVAARGQSDAIDPLQALAQPLGSSEDLLTSRPSWRPYEHNQRGYDFALPRPRRTAPRSSSKCPEARRGQQEPTQRQLD